MRRRALMLRPFIATAAALFVAVALLSSTSSIPTRPKQLATSAAAPPTSVIAATAVLPPTPTGTLQSSALALNEHPVNSDGYVTDGSPQLDDAHCWTPPGSGQGSTPVQAFWCLAARHPGLVAFVAAITASQEQARLAAYVQSPAGVPCGANVSRWYPQLAQYPWPIAEMERIMCRESGGNPFAVNRSSGACGLFQLLSCPPGGLDGYTNIRLAYQTKYAPSGLAPWSETA